MCQMRWADFVPEEQLKTFHDKGHLGLGLELPSTPQVMVSENYGIKYWGQK